MLADCHTHCRCSVDSETPPEAMAQAALARGLEVLCLTDHVELQDDWGVPAPAMFDWGPIREAHEALVRDFGGQLELPLGAELGGAALDWAKADRWLDAMPDMDFVITSVHRVSDRFGGVDQCVTDAFTPEKLPDLLEDYFGELLATVRWGRFSALGHLTLPDRYAQRRSGLPPVDFGPYLEHIDQILHLLIETGRGLELNTDRGSPPIMPQKDILARYRALGGEIITLGSDAHTPEFVGAGIAEGQALLRELGFRYVCTFRAMEPVFHKL